MKYKRLYLRLNQKELISAQIRFHFDDQEDLFVEVYKKLTKCIQPVLYYEYDHFDRNRMIGVISLGNGPDRLEETYQAEEQFAKAYAAECLSLELLSCSYKQLREIIFRDRRQFLETMHFCEQEELKKMVPHLQESWDPFPISMNPFCALTPSKTVIFLGTIGAHDCVTKHTCRLCDQKHCIFRRISGE